jgi:predicted nucleotidyltransferase
MSKSLDREFILRTLQEELPYLRERYGVVRIALYGSFSHGTPAKTSDVDLLVELGRPLGLEFVSLAQYLEKRLGRKVDLATFDTLNRSLSHPRYSKIAQNVQRTLTDVAIPAGQ